MISVDDKMIELANIYENHVSNAKYHVVYTQFEIYIFV